MPGKDHVEYYYVRCRAYAELQGTQIDITGYEITYALNSIPIAQIFPTVGREPINNKEAKAVDALLNAQPFTPVKIYSKFETDKDSPADDPGFPYDEDVLVFDGYITGVTYQSTRNPAGGSVSLVAGAMGWLTGLRGTTAQTNTATVKGPGGFAELANLNNGKITMFSTQMAFTADGRGIVTDLWKEFVKPFFFDLIDNESVWGEAPNDSADAALSKMDDENVFSGDATNQLPLTFGEGADDIEIVKEYVGQGISKEVYAVWRHADLWTALRNIADKFMFFIVPLIETASCVPAYGALAGEPHRYITTDEYHDIRINMMTPSKVVKVVITGDEHSSPFSPTPIPSAIIGLHSVEDVWADPELAVRGFTVAIPAPDWLNGVTPVGKITRDSLGGDQLVIPDAVNPTANVTTPAIDYQEFYGKYVTSDIGDRCAKTIAQHMIFAERTGSVTGRYRLDIGPGSLIKVQVIDDKFAEEGADEKALYGQVQAVRLSMRAGAAGAVGSAHTSFNLKYVRTAQEQEGVGGALTSQNHPLYNKRFVGVKLWSE